MSRSNVAGAFAAVVIGVVAGAAVALVVLPRADLGAAAAVAPGEQRVDRWDDAAALAGVPLYAPADAGDPSMLVVHGVMGDATRPVEARFGDGLIMVQAHGDLLPAENSGELVSVTGADDAWWQTASDGRRLAVRFGDTLALLSGRSDDELVATAREMIAIGSVP